MIDLETAIHDTQQLVRRLLGEGNKKVFFVCAHGRLGVSPEPFTGFKDYPSEAPHNHEVSSLAEVEPAFRASYKAGLIRLG